MAAWRSAIAASGRRLRPLGGRRSGYALAVLASAAAIAVHVPFSHWLGESPVLLPVLAVLAAAYVGGLGPGMLATILCTVGLAYLLLEPGNGRWHLDIADKLRLFFFVLVGTTISLISAALHRSRRQGRTMVASLARAKQRTQDTLASITDCYFAVDANWHIVEMNERAAEYFRRPPEQLLGRSFWEAMPQCLGSEFERRVHHAAAQPGAIHFEAPSCVTAGRWAEYHAYPSLDNERGIRFYFRDITDRKAAESALRRSEEQLRAILDNALAVVYLKEPGGRYLLVNRRVEQVLGLPRQQIEGKTDYELLPRDVADACAANDRQVIAGGRAMEFEERMPAEQGQSIWMSVKFPLRDSSGAVYALCGISADITRRKQTEAALERRTRQLTVLSQTSQAISAVLEAPAIVRTLVASGMELVSAEAGAAGLVIDGRVTFHEYMRQGGTSSLDAVFAPGEGVPGHVLQTAQPYLTNDAEHDPYVVPEVRQSLGFHSLINVPILGPDGQVLGCFEMHNKRGGGAFDAEDVSMLQGLAASAAIALENAGSVEDLKRAEEALRLVEERWRLAVESGTLGTWDYSALSGHLDWSARLKAIFALPPDTAPSYELFISRIHPEDRPRAEEVIRRAMDPAGDGEYEDEFRIVLPDGTVRWVSNRGRTFFGDVGGTRRAMRSIGVAMDSTDRRLAEETLRVSEEHLRLATEAADIGTWSYDAVGGAVTWSTRAKAIFGLSADAPVSYELFLSMIHPDDREKARQAAERAADPSGKGEYECEFRIIRRHDGAVRWITGKGRAFFADVGGQRRPVRLIGTTLDITDRKRAEEDLLSAKEQAESANQAKDQFLATLSHELRTPLTPVLATASSLEDDERLTPEVREDLEMIRRNVDLEARLIDDLLDLTRIARGKLELQRDVADVHTTITHAVRTSSDEAVAAKQLQIEMHLDAADHHAWADSARLEQVFWNLLKNAVKFTPPGGRIVVRTSNPQRGRVRVEVSDTGIGIEEEALGRIFGAFQQQDRTVTRRFGGLGLGLAICKAIVELHGGTIRAHSAGRGKGSTFSVELGTWKPAPAPARAPGPAIPSRRVTYHEPAVGAATHGEACPAPQKPRILLVEDHPDTARIVGHLLRRHGYDVQTAGDMASALGMAHEQRFGLLISDLGLPDGSGLDLMRQLRTSQQTIRGIALSGYGMEEDLRASRDAGFAEHLVKPVDMHRLESAIQRLSGDH